jgi:hypothetical protein
LARKTTNGKIRLPGFLKGTQMPINKESVSLRLDELIKLAQRGNVEGIGEVTSGTISILQILYGPDNEKVKAYIQYHQNCIRRNDINTIILQSSIIEHTMGVLKSIKSEVEMGLVGKMEVQAQGGILGDFITLAKESLDESKDVAAVLVSAALEDALKRFALQNNLDVAEKDMTEVINALRTKGLLKDPQASIVQSHAKLRNKAFHANWDKIEKPSVTN